MTGDDNDVKILTLRIKKKIFLFRDVIKWSKFDVEASLWRWNYQNISLLASDRDTFRFGRNLEIDRGPWSPVYLDWIWPNTTKCCYLFVWSDAVQSKLVKLGLSHTVILPQTDNDCSLVSVLQKDRKFSNATVHQWLSLMDSCVGKFLWNHFWASL